MRTYCDLCGTVGAEPVLTVANLTNDRRSGSARRYHESCAMAVQAFRDAERAQESADLASAFDRFRAERVA